MTLKEVYTVIVTGLKLGPCAEQPTACLRAALLSSVSGIVSTADLSESDILV